MMATDYLPIEHDNEDTNRSTLAAHHQLGTDRYNASPGNHTHAKGDLGSIPFFDGISVELDPNDLDDSVAKIWDIFAQYGVQVTVRVPVITYPPGFVVFYFDEPAGATELVAAGSATLYDGTPLDIQNFNTPAIPGSTGKPPVPGVSGSIASNDKGINWQTEPGLAPARYGDGSQWPNDIVFECYFTMNYENKYGGDVYGGDILRLGSWLTVFSNYGDGMSIDMNGGGEATYWYSPEFSFFNGPSSEALGDDVRDYLTTHIVVTSTQVFFEIYRLDGTQIYGVTFPRTNVVYKTWGDWWWGSGSGLPYINVATEIGYGDKNLIENFAFFTFWETYS